MQFYLIVLLFTHNLRPQVGDALVEPFWPLGTGANHAVLSAMDASWIVKQFMEKEDPDTILKSAQISYPQIYHSCFFFTVFVSFDPF